MLHAATHTLFLRVRNPLAPVPEDGHPPLVTCFHCLSECPAFSDLRDQWCRQCSIHPDSVFLGSPPLALPSQLLSQLCQLNPRPCLVCWAGLRAFRLTVTLSSPCGAPHHLFEVVCFQLSSLPPLGGAPQHLLRSCSAFSFLRSLLVSHAGLQLFGAPVRCSEACS